MTDTTSLAKLRIDPRGVAWLTLDKPDVHNAFDDALIDELNVHLDQLHDAAERDEVRIVVLGSQGKHFSAGADLNWMKLAAMHTREDNERDAMNLAEMLRAQGYRSHMIGKWHLGSVPDALPTEHGFATFAGQPDQALCHNMSRL